MLAKGSRGSRRTRSGAVLTILAVMSLQLTTLAWEQVLSDGQVVVERRPHGREGLFELRISGHANVTPEQMLQTIWKHEEYIEFVPRLKKLVILSDDGTD